MGSQLGLNYVLVGPGYNWLSHDERYRMYQSMIAFFNIGAHFKRGSCIPWIFWDLLFGILASDAVLDKYSQSIEGNPTMVPIWVLKLISLVTRLIKAANIKYTFIWDESITRDFDDYVKGIQSYYNDNFKDLTPQDYKTMYPNLCAKVYGNEREVKTEIDQFFLKLILCKNYAEVINTVIFYLSEQSKNMKTNQSMECSYLHKWVFGDNQADRPLGPRLYSWVYDDSGNKETILSISGKEVVNQLHYAIYALLVSHAIAMYGTSKSALCTGVHTGACLFVAFTDISSKCSYLQVILGALSSSTERSSNGNQLQSSHRSSSEQKRNYSTLRQSVDESHVYENVDFNATLKPYRWFVDIIRGSTIVRVPFDSSKERRMFLNNLYKGEKLI